MKTCPYCLPEKSCPYCGGTRMVSHEVIERVRKAEQFRRLRTGSGEKIEELSLRTGVHPEKIKHMQLGLIEPDFSILKRLER